MNLHDLINEKITGRLALISHNESDLLSKYARLDGDYTEIGCLWGGTAILAALSKRDVGASGHVYTIDSMRGGFWVTGDPLYNREIPTLEKVEQNIKLFGLEENITVIVGDSNPLPLPKDIKPTVVLIDGDHRYTGCMIDWMNVKAIKPNYILIHDYDNGHPDVQRVVGYIRKHEHAWKEVDRADSLIVFKNVGLSDSPTVSVIVPTYNRTEYLGRALSSINNQTYRDYEIIIVNDAGISINNVIKSLPKIAPNILLIEHSENKGLAASRNTGIKAARGEYITFLDDDDIMLDNHLSTQVEWMDRGYPLIYTDVYWWIEEKYMLEHMSIDYRKDRLYSGCIFPVMAAMIRRELFELEMFDESLKSHEDYDLWLRLSQYIDFKHVPVFTAAYSKREGSDQISNQPYHVSALNFVKEKNKVPVVDKLYYLLEDGLMCHVLQNFNGNILDNTVTYKKGQNVKIPKQAAIDYARAGFVKIFVKVEARDD